MNDHLTADGQFQSDKYPTCPPGKVPLSCKDVTAQDLLWEYAQRRRSVDAAFSDDLESALKNAGYVPIEHRIWRCFHCDEVFADPDLARDHFGSDQCATPVCQIADLAHLLRLQEYELRGHREEDSQVIRQVYALGADHHGKLRDEEEKGYARGLADGRGLTADLVKQVRLLLDYDGGDGSKGFHAFKSGDAREEVQKLLKDFPE